MHGADLRDATCIGSAAPPHDDSRCRACVQMEEEGVPSTTLREVSLLLMLSESNHIVK